LQEKNRGLSIKPFIGVPGQVNIQDKPIPWDFHPFHIYCSQQAFNRVDQKPAGCLASGFSGL
jgi:hypothetical protein